MKSIFALRRSFSLVVVAAIILGGGTGAVLSFGVIHTTQDSNMTEREIDDVMEQIEAAKGFGFISQFGRTGRIQTFRGGVLTIRTPLGTTEARIDRETTIQRTKQNTIETLEEDDLQPDVLVTIIGPIGVEQGNATTIEVVPEGDTGFQIQPRSTGPLSLPVFP